MLQRATIVACVIAVVALSGCVPQPGVERSDEPEITSLGLDAKDYDEMAARMSQSVLVDSHLPLDGSKVVALGPVDTDDCLHHFDTRTFQEKLQTVLMRSHTIQVSFATDMMSRDDAVRARYDVIREQWMKESTVDPATLRTYGNLAKVDYLLFGRLSEQSITKARINEVTYTFNWKIGDCETGLLAWQDDMSIVKRDPRR